MENKFRQVCGLVDYNTYCKIKNTSYYSSVIMALVNKLALAQYPDLSCFTNLLVFLSLMTSSTLILSHGEAYTKDVQQIRNLYQEFITRYNQLNKVFSLDDPIQIYAMFQYLLYRGYLSVDKEFLLSDDKARNLSGLLGTGIIAGQGVCRHISSMLTDIFNDYGIEANLLGVYYSEHDVSARVIAELFELLQKHIIDAQLYYSRMEEIEALEEELKKSNGRNISTKLYGNHAITFAIKDEKSYYLDATQRKIYRMKEPEKSLFYCEPYHEASFRLLSSFHFNGFKESFKIKGKLAQYPSVSREEEECILSQMLMLCDNNIDIFEQFYKENREIYHDISSQLVKIKKLSNIK